MDWYKKGEVIVLPFPFIDSELTKRRPALVLSSDSFNADHAHLIVGMITSAQASFEKSDVKINDWKRSGLKKPCFFRFKIFTIQKNLILGKVGELSNLDQENIFKELSKNLL